MKKHQAQVASRGEFYQTFKHQTTSMLCKLFQSWYIREGSSLQEHKPFKEDEPVKETEKKHPLKKKETLEHGRVFQERRL